MWILALVAWVVIGMIWAFCSAFIVILYPLWESREALTMIGRGIVKVCPEFTEPNEMISCQFRTYFLLEVESMLRAPPQRFQSEIASSSSVHRWGYRHRFQPPGPFFLFLSLFTYKRQSIEFAESFQGCVRLMQVLIFQPRVGAFETDDRLNRSSFSLLEFSSLYMLEPNWNEYFSPRHRLPLWRS